MFHEGSWLKTPRSDMNRECNVELELTNRVTVAPLIVFIIVASGCTPSPQTGGDAFFVFPFQVSEREDARLPVRRRY